MKNKALLLSILASTIISTNVYAESFVSDDCVNFRTGASTEDGIITQLAYGTPVDVIQYDIGNGWSLVNTEYGTGYIFNQYVANTDRTSEMLAIANQYNSGTDKLIIVDTNGYPMTYVFDGYSYNWNPIAVFNCSIGKEETPTPTGIFSIQAHRDVLNSADTDEYFVCDFAYDSDGAWCFHSTLFEKGTYNPVDDRVGCRISNGCIRLHLEDAEWIWQNCNNGTTVIIL